MYCPNCGKENDDDAKFCEECGSLMHEEDNAKILGSDFSMDFVEPLKASKHSSGKFIKIAVLIVVCIGIGVGGAFFVSKDFKKGEKEEIVKKKTNIVENKNVVKAISEGQQTEKENNNSENSSQITKSDSGSKLPNTNNDTMDLSACKNPNNYQYITSSDGSFRFGYPKSLFNESRRDDNNNHYLLSFAKDNETKIKADYSVTEATGDSLTIAQNYIDNCINENHLTVTYRYPQTDVSKAVKADGSATMIAMGYSDSAKKKWQYHLVKNDGSRTYVMKIAYEDPEYTNPHKTINYVVDCMYRACSFSNTTYQLRTFAQFQKDLMGTKK